MPNPTREAVREALASALAGADAFRATLLYDLCYALGISATSVYTEIVDALLAVPAPEPREGYLCGKCDKWVNPAYPTEKPCRGLQEHDAPPAPRGAVEEVVLSKRVVRQEPGVTEIHLEAREVLRDGPMRVECWWSEEDEAYIAQLTDTEPEGRPFTATHTGIGATREEALAHLAVGEYVTALAVADDAAVRGTGEREDAEPVAHTAGLSQRDWLINKVRKRTARLQSDTALCGPDGAPLDCGKAGDPVTNTDILRLCEYAEDTRPGVPREVTEAEVEAVALQYYEKSCRELGLRERPWSQKERTAYMADVRFILTAALAAAPTPEPREGEREDGEPYRVEVKDALGSVVGCMDPDDAEKWGRLTSADHSALAPYTLTPLYTRPAPPVPDVTEAMREFVESFLDAYGDDVVDNTIGGENLLRYWLRRHRAALRPTSGEGT